MLLVVQLRWWSEYKENMKQLITKIKQIEQEQHRRKSSPLACYNKGKVHHKQMAFHKCTKRNRWVFGGNRSGKTQCGAVETVWLARGIHPYRANRPSVSCWVVSLSQQVQRDVAQQKVLYYLDKSWIVDIVMVSGHKGSPQNGVIDYIDVANVLGGTSRIAFKSCEAGREKFQGASLDFVWFDEEPPQDIYEECRMRVLDKNGHIFGTMTPLKGQTWVYDEIYLNCHNSSEVWCITMEWADNPYLKSSEVQLLSQSLSQDMLESRRYGRFTQLAGLVYSEFDQSNVVEPFDIPAHWQDTMSIDPGLANPLSCHWYARDEQGNVYVVAEHYQANRDVDYHVQQIKAICQRLGWKSTNGSYSALMDSASNQHTLSGRQSVAELFAERGIAVNTQVNKHLYTGISKVKALLKGGENGKLYVFSSCTNMIRELKGYQWADNDRPVKRDDHAMDELRYYVCHLSKQNAPKPTLTAIQRDKLRLAKSLGRRR